MDYDRKSVGSSFYGGRRPSGDALNHDFPSPTPHYTDTPTHARQDSRASYYDPTRPPRASAEYLNNPPTAGYNSSQYFDAGRPEPVKAGYDEEAAFRDEPFDIYADFNNAGPRYSKAAFVADDGYRRVNSPSLSKVEAGLPSGAAPVEMVTVPALGPEWKSSELRNMTKLARQEDKSERRAQKWKEWRRGERGLCGRYFTRKFLAWFLFAFCIAVGLVLAFTIPRVPDFQINQDTPLTTATGDFNKSIPVQFLRAPANFSFPASADLQIDTNSNYLPLTFQKIHADVFDLGTGRQIGIGDLGHMTFPAKTFSQLSVPLNFSYVATNSSDQTWNNWYNGCKNHALFTDGKRPFVSLRLILAFDIAGLIGTKHAATDITNANCPIELSQSAG